METRKAEKEFKTASGVPLKSVYTPDDAKDIDYDRDVGPPGNPPFTRGPYPNMYRDRLWRIRQLTGFGTPEDFHERTEFIREAGQSGLTTQADMSSACMFDVDHPLIASRKDEIGLYGAPLNTLRDWETILDGVDLENEYIAVLGSPYTTPFNLSCYLAVAEKRGIPPHKLAGSGQNCMLSVYISVPHPQQLAPRIGLKMIGDVVEFCAQNMPRFMPVSNSGYNIREIGITAHQELGALFANNIAIIDELLSRGRLGIDDFAYGLGTSHLWAGDDFFEEIAKFRAARRMWCRLLKERYHAQDAKSFRFRIHARTAAATLTYQQPFNNIVRVAYQVLVAALGGVQSLDTACYDEAISAPTKESALLAVRTQQICQYELNVTNMADPLGGSYCVESLTNEVEKRSWDYLRKIEEQGGFIAALESGWIHRDFMQTMFERQKKIQSGEKKVVGVNCFKMAEDPFKIPHFEGNPQAGEELIARLERFRKERDNPKLSNALDELRRVCETGENIVPAVLNAVKANATTGDIGKVYRQVFPTWVAPTLL